MLIAYRSLIFIFIFNAVWNIVSADDIPVMLWNINGNALHIKPVPALGHNDKMFSENLKDIHLQESSILVFTVNKFSLEDFSANEKALSLNSTLNNIESFLDKQPYMLLPSVKDPLNYIHKAHCGVQEIVVDNKVDESVMQSVSSAMKRSCVVILHISNYGIVTKEDEINSVFLPSFENSNKNIVGIFTGVKSSWGVPNGDRHTFRNLLQAEAPPEDNFVNITGCLIMYAESALLKVGKETNSTALPFPPKTDGSSCSNSSVLQLEFKTSGPVTAVTLKFDFDTVGSAWKTSATIQMTGDKVPSGEIELKNNYMEAPLGFSYSCGDLVLTAKNKSYDVTLVMKGFQVQPYEVKGVFSESFDCVPFFTIPIWMGIFVSIIFIVITNIGVYALFSVRTMDRFDDPKGKPITVGNTND
jgi:hypothetical protein